jgi:integrase
MASRKPKPVRVTITRYHDPVTGRRCSADTPGAVARKVRSRTYYAYIPPEADPTGRPVRVPLGTEDESQAWVELHRRLRKLAELAAGIRDRTTEEAARPLCDQVAEWVATLRARNVSPKQVCGLQAHVLKLAELAGWERLADVTSSSCETALGRLQAEKGRGAARAYAGRSAQTRNHYLAHLRQFLRWCQQDGRLRAYPIAGVRPIATETDRRHDRRSPTHDEIGRLIQYLQGEGAVVRRGMTGPARALAYRLAMASGLRAGELGSLGREAFDLAAGTVTLQAAYSKHRRTDVIQLPAWLVEELKAWFAAGGGCWPGFRAEHPGRVLRHDLAAAGVAYSVPGPHGRPLYFDMHALRHWYCSWAASLPDMDLRTLLSLTRHSTPQLALKTYAKPQQQRIRAAVSQMAAPPTSPPGPVPPTPPEDTAGTDGPAPAP